jgi:S-methylmethionine-dependent homocysteine/selenocysteine methylase
MHPYRNSLPQLSQNLFLTDGGIETTLIFHQGFELPYFAAFYLFRDAKGEQGLRNYFETYARLAKKFNCGLILESATWRASADWGNLLDYTAEQLDEANRKAIYLLESIRNQYENERTKIVISGCVGPGGDGYIPTNAMSAANAEAYHEVQIATFAATSADMISAITMNYTEEAIGIAFAAKNLQMPVAISFTVETDGKLPTGQSLRDAIEQVDRATYSYPAYYMINCAHATHFQSVLVSGEEWAKRIRGLRANASRMSHAELNESPTLDIGNPSELACEYAEFKRRLPHLNVFGGCCGTDHRHVEQIAEQCKSFFNQ